MRCGVWGCADKHVHSPCLWRCTGGIAATGIALCQDEQRQRKKHQQELQVRPGRGTAWWWSGGGVLDVNTFAQKNRSRSNFVCGTPHLTHLLRLSTGLARPPGCASCWRSTSCLRHNLSSAGCGSVSRPTASLLLLLLGARQPCPRVAIWVLTVQVRCMVI
jgi:hypothetical protein